MGCSLYGKNRIKDLLTESLKREYREAKRQGDEKKAEQVHEKLHSLQNGVLGIIMDKVPTGI